MSQDEAVRAAFEAQETLLLNLAGIQHVAVRAAVKEVAACVTLLAREGAPLDMLLSYVQAAYDAAALPEVRS